MGPPPFGSGNRAYRGSTRLRFTGFNGATAFRQWKHATLGTLAAVVVLLQWGHRLSAVGTVAGLEYNPPGGLASMGPPPFGSGNDLMTCCWMS